MGTITYHKPKGVKAVDSIMEHAVGAKAAPNVVAKSATREAVFIVYRDAEPSDYLKSIYVPEADGSVKSINIFKLSLAPRDHYNFGYKDMSECSGPCGCECPPSIIAAASKLQPVTDETPSWKDSSLIWAHQYRERSLKVWKLKSMKRNLKVGATVKLAKPLSFGGVELDEFKVWRGRIRGRKGMSTAFQSTKTGGLCNISAAQLDGAEISEAA